MTIKLLKNYFLLCERHSLSLLPANNSYLTNGFHAELTSESSVYL